MKKTYAYIKYVVPPLNKHGSFDAANATTLCLGVTLNPTEREKYIYRQAEIEYPEDRFHVREAGGRRDLVDGGGEMQNLNELLKAGMLWGRMFKPTRGASITMEFACLEDLASGQAAPVDSNTQTPECQHCLGKGKVTAFVDCEDKSQSGMRQITCLDCRGEGTVTIEYLERRAAGKALRDDRLLRNFSLRQEAHRRGMAVRDLSDLEHGRLQVPGEVDQCL